MRLLPLKPVSHEYKASRFSYLAKFTLTDLIVTALDRQEFHPSFGSPFQTLPKVFGTFSIERARICQPIKKSKFSLINTKIYLKTCTPGMHLNQIIDVSPTKNPNDLLQINPEEVELNM